jgi:hypothetical protein
MPLPKTYLTSVKNLSAILNAIKTAQAPPKFTQRFLESLGFKTTADRLIVGVLKSLGFLQDDGKPTSRYYEFLDQTQSERVLAEGIREAFGDLFQINRHAHKLGKTEAVNKFKTLSQGQLSKSVLDKMGMTFTSLVKLADFDASAPSEETKPKKKTPESEKDVADKAHEISREVRLGGLVYNIQIVLPESRDPAVYDALFRSLKEHMP